MKTFLVPIDCALCFHVKTYVMKHTDVGHIGECVAARFLRRKGFVMHAKNYTRPWGEIDIIAEKGGMLRFVEVKTVAREANVLRETENEGFNPLENVHEGKLKRLNRAAESYIAENAIDAAWCIDAVTVELFVKDKTARCELFENVR